MSADVVRALGLMGSLVYAAFIVWIYGQQPRTFAEVTGGMSAAVGAYAIDRASFEDGRRFFSRELYPEARAAFARADPAERDPVTQFYIAYAYYREGWGRLYHDDALYREGLAHAERAIAVAPDGRVYVDDPDLAMHTADELKAELERGLTREADDLNPLRVFRKRK